MLGKLFSLAVLVALGYLGASHFPQAEQWLQQQRQQLPDVSQLATVLETPRMDALEQQVAALQQQLQQQQQAWQQWQEAMQNEMQQQVVFESNDETYDLEEEVNVNNLGVRQRQQDLADLTERLQRRALQLAP